MARYAIISEGDRPLMYKSVFLFQCEQDFEKSTSKALKIARTHEKDYLGAEGHRVVWRLIDIETLDPLGTLIDGHEVYGEPCPVPKNSKWTIDTNFTPEDSEFGQSGVEFHDCAPREEN